MMPPQSTWMLRLFGVLRRHWRWLLFGTVLATLTSLAAIGLMTVAGHFVAAMALAGVAGLAINYFTPAALIRALAIVRTGGRYAERLVTHDATLRGLSSLRAWLFRRLIPLAPAGLMQLRSAELFSRLRADIDALEHFYLGILIPVVVALAASLLAAGLFAVYLPLGLIPLTLGLLLAGVGLPLWAHRRAAQDATQQVLAKAELRGALVDALRGHGELLVAGLAQRYRQRIEQIDHALASGDTRLEALRALGGSGVTFLAQATVLGILPFGINALVAGTLAPAVLVMLCLLALASFEALAPLPEALAAWRTTRVCAERVFALVDQAPAIQEPQQSQDFTHPPAVQFRGVRLRYADNAPWALDGVDLDLEVGARIAIVGPSGSGKSSLIGALLKFYPRAAGQIWFGGQSIDAICGDALRQQIALIAQHSALFNLSLADNLRLGRPRASDAELAQAIAAAQLTAFVDALPQGLDTVLGEGGARVSGGEARRIVIARALLQDAPLLIMDEPTEGLDAITAQQLYKALAVASENRSLLLITHRLGGLYTLVDTVITLNEGRLGQPLSLAAWQAGSDCNLLS